MRIAQVTLRFDAPGGVETNVRAVAGGLRAAGEDVRVFASDLFDEGRWERRSNMSTSVDGVPVVRFPVYKRLVPGLTMPLMPGLIDALRLSEAQVIHAHSHRYGHVLQSAAVSHQLGIPLVVSTHYHPADRREPGLKRGLLRVQDHLFGATAYRHAAALIVESRLEARLLAEFAPSQRVQVIPPGVDLGAWGHPDQDRVPAGLPDRYVLYAGRIASNKGLDGLIEAVARIPAGQRPFLVFLGPDWGERARLERLAEQRGIGERVRWLGIVADAGEWRQIFRRAELFVLPSEWEAFGLVLLEAMAAGTPIVATAVGGVPEVLDEGRAGALVAYGDREGLARTIERVLSDADELERLRRAGRARVQELTWAKAVERHRALYRSLAG